MMLKEDHWRRFTPKQFVGAFAPFPRSTWIHPFAPRDDFDRVCKIIQARAREIEVGFGGGPSPTERPQNGDGAPPLDNKPSHHRAEEQRKETSDLGVSAKCEDKLECHTESTLPCRYLLGHRHPCVANPARILSPVMEVEMKLNEEEKAERIRNSEKDVEDKQRIEENSLKKIWVPESISGTDKQSHSSEPGPVVTNPICCATEEVALHQQGGEDLLLPLRDTCKSEDEQGLKRSPDSDADDDFFCLPGVRSCATDSSDHSSLSDLSDTDMDEDDALSLPDELSPKDEQGSSDSSAEMDFPPLCTIRTGIDLRPTEALPSGKVHGQWKTPLLFHSHDTPAAALARGTTAPAPAPVQVKAEAPQANPETNAPPEAAAQQKAYDLLADFPTLQPATRPSALGALRDWNPKKKDAKKERDLISQSNAWQASGALCQRRMENVPFEVSSICAGDQKSVANLPTFGPAREGNTPTVNCGEMKANNQPPPRVAGADGVGVYARTWASAAKAGMKQAAAPQEKARPCNSRQIVTVNRAKGRGSAIPNTATKVTPSQQGIGFTCGTQLHNPNQFVRPGFRPTNQHSGAQAHRANCPPGFRCPHFPFKQGGGVAPKHNHL